jgi:tetratricopeptide (TPR) repeat protein
MVSVFLSHSSKDKPFVRELAGFLRQDDRIKVWLDEAEIRPGDNIVSKIADGLDADVVLLILSPDSVDSQWVKEEWTDAYWEQVNARKTKLVGVLYRDCRIPRLLRNKKYFDLRTNQPEGFREIRTWLLGQEPERPRPNHAPARPPLFIGREEELRNLRERLGQPGAVVHVQGMPGRGKTLLAIEFAHRYQQDFEAVYWLPCQSGSLVALAGELSRQLGLRLEGDLDQVVCELKDYCAAKRCLLVLDNVEEESPGQLIPGGAASVLITTRRDDLRFLQFHQPAPLPLFTEAQCFELFRTVIGEAEVERHRVVCQGLFRRLGYLPIGVAVAAGLIRYDLRYTIPSLAANLPADVTALICEAIAAVAPAAKTLLDAMAACALGGFRLSLAASVAEMEGAAALAAINELASRSLVEELDRTDRRYRLHALVRESADGAAFGKRHAEAVRKQFRNWEKDWRTCEEDLPEFQVAFDWGLGRYAEAEAGNLLGDLAYSGFRLTERVGRPTDAFEICERRVRAAEARNDRARVQAWLGNQALILQAWGRLEEAMALHKQEEAICRDLGNRAGLQASLGNQALILKAWGRLEEAMALLKQKEAICRDLGNRAGLGRSLGNQALILRRWGRPEEAMDLHKQEEAICRDLGDRAGLQASLGNQALVLKAWGRLEEAMALLKQQEAMCRDLGDRAGQQASLGNQAVILQAWGRLEEAMDFLKQQEAICRDLGDRAGLQRSLGNQALILTAWGRLEEAIALHKQEEAICRDLGDRADLQRSLGNQAVILQAWGRLEEAMALHKQEEAICRDLGDRADLAICHWNMGLILGVQGQIAEARRLLLGALATFEELKMPRGTEKVRGALERLPPDPQ